MAVDTEQSAAGTSANPTGADADGARAAALAAALQVVAELNGDIEHRFLGLRKLMEVTNRVNPGALLDDVLQQVHDTFRTILPYERVGLALLDDRGEMLEQRWVQSSARSVKMAVGYSAPLRKTTLAELLKSGEPRILNDLAAYLVNRQTSEHTRLLLEEGMRSSLTVPLSASGKPLGFIFFSGTRVGTYAEQHAGALRRIAGPLSVLVSRACLYEMVLKAQQESDRLLRNVLPEPIVKRLKAGEQVIADGIDSATVVFVDIVNFVRTASKLSPAAVIVVLNRVFSAFDALCEQYGVEKIKTIGDCYMAASGVPQPRADNARVLVRMALEIREYVAQHEFGGQRLALRIGINSGPVVAGVIGRRKFIYDLWGDAVNVASRMESTGREGAIQVTRGTFERIKDQFVCEAMGTVNVKGKGAIEVWHVIGEPAGAVAR